MKWWTPQQQEMHLSGKDTQGLSKPAQNKHTMHMFC